MKLKNNSKSKIIGIGEVTILPEKTATIHDRYREHPIVKFYINRKMVSVIEEPVEIPVETNDGNSNRDTVDLEVIRKARLASLKDITDENLSKLAEELGISPSECVDIADMTKKVRAALRKK